MYPLFTAKKAGQLQGMFMFIVLYDFVYDMVFNFVGIKFSHISSSFLSMIISEVLYMWYVRYNICSTWFLDIRISTCSGNICQVAKLYMH